MTTATLSPIPGPDSLTPEWFEAHRTHITATDIAPILGRSDYKTPLDVFAEKTGRVKPFEGNEHTRRGQRYEPVILADYAEATQLEVETPLPLFVHPKLSFLAATPDARVLESDHNQMLPAVPEFGVEAKFSMSPARANALGDEGTDDIPDDWLLQTQTQMSVMGWMRVDLAVLLYGRLRIYPVQRNDELIGIIESAAKEMAERIANDDPPEPTWEHPQTPRLIRAMYGIKAGTVVALSEECEKAWESYSDIGVHIKELEKCRDAFKAKILHAMGESEIGQLPGIGMELVRSTVERAEYTVKASTYTTFRGRKARTL